MALGTYEHAELRYLLGRLQPGDTFVDVGAHIGYFALPIARRVGPSGRVIAVEPSPSSVALLRKNVQLNGFNWLTIIEAAASDRDGQASLVVSSHSPMWNTLLAESIAGGIDGMIPVRTRSIDSLIAEAGWPRVAAIKLDVEGFESQVLSGSEDTLRRNPWAFLLFEVSGGNDERIAASVQTLRWFEERGYCFRVLGGRQPDQLVTSAKLLPRLHAPYWQDYLFNVIAEKYRPGYDHRSRPPVHVASPPARPLG